MSKLTTLASLAVAVVGFATISGGSAIAACLNPADTSDLSMTSSTLDPHEAGNNNRMSRQEELSQGNQCNVTPESYSTAATGYDTHPNESDYHQHNRG
ncbi:MAG TPA: hypothetical protein VL418_13840 [Devosiaceae bacterium]|jgi:hypothetical protein|nr:hypothetical protein [Devosiaceae bacterium]